MPCSTGASFSGELPAIPVAAPYPQWQFYPSRSPAPDWVPGVVDAFAEAREEIDSTAEHSEPVTSDKLSEHYVLP